MDANAFLTALARAFDRKALPTEVRAKSWTRFMTARILELSDASGLHVCASKVGRAARSARPSQRHMPREFLFDFTLYAAWEAWSLPAVIIEHENAWTETGFLQDFWKLLLGFAPLRVMVGYAATADAVDDRVRVLLDHAAKERWTYPVGAEDLVLLRSPKMPWPHWRILHRAAGGAWCDRGVQSLDGRAVNR